MWRKWISIAVVTSMLGTSMPISVFGSHENQEDKKATYETASSSDAEIVEEILDEDVENENLVEEQVNYQAAQTNQDDSDFIIEDGVLEKYVGNGGDVTIPDGVTGIGYAFKECESLVSLKIPNSVTTIITSFEGCKNLQRLEIPNSVTKMWLGNQVFKSCYNLVSVENIPNGVETIGIEAFRYCSNLVSLQIPDSVNNIKTRAFANCSKLNNINIPNGVGFIDIDTFRGCQSLNSIELPNSIYTIGDSAFRESGLKNLTIPNSVTDIGIAAFKDCKKLNSITIPNSVMNIGEGAFDGCGELTIYAESGSYAETYANTNNIPFQSTSPTPTQRQGFLARFISWNPEEQVVYVEKENREIGYSIIDKTDLSFLDCLDDLPGNYVWVVDNPADMGQLLSITPVEEKWGTVTVLEDSYVIIDGANYLLDHSFWLPGSPEWYEGKYVQYFLLEGQVVQLNRPEERTGVLMGWNDVSQEITIDGVTYPTQFRDVSYLGQLDLWIGKTIHYELLNDVVYGLILENTKLTKVKSYDSSIGTVVFEDGSHYTVASNVANIGDLLGKWAICTIKISTEGVEEVVGLEAIEANLKVRMVLEYGQLTYKNGTYSVDGTNFKKGEKIELPFVVDMQNQCNISEEELSAYKAELQADEILSLTANSFNLELPEGFYYEWVDGRGFENGKVLKLGDRWIIGGILKLKPEFVPEKDREEFTLQATVATNKGRSSSNSKFTMVNQDYSEWIEETAEILKELTKEVEKVNYISSDIGTLLTKEQAEKLNIALAQWVTTVLDAEVSDEAKELLYDSYEYDTSSKTVKSTYIITIDIDNIKYPKKGERRFEFQLIYNDYKYILEHFFDTAWNPRNAHITWRMLDTSGINLVGAGMSHILHAEAEADLESMSKVIKKALKKTKEGVDKGIKDDLGFSLNVFDETLNEVLDEMDGNPKKYLMMYAVNLTKEWVTANFWQEDPDYKGSIKNTTKTIFSKMVKIKCPVDVYVYHDGNLIGLVKDNRVDDKLEKDLMGSYVSVEGDVKTVYLPDDTYSIKLIGNDIGTMDYIVYEYKDTQEPSRTVYFDNLPLEKGKIYTGNVNEGVDIAVSSYALTTNGTTIEADYDTARGDTVIDKPASDNSQTTTNPGNGNSHSGGSSGGGGSTSSQNRQLSGHWVQDDIGWWYQFADGTYPKNSWNLLGYNQVTDWYHFNADGYMDYGWFTDSDGNIYYLNPLPNGYQGAMLAGWQLIDGYWYYFNPSSGGPKGALLINTTTPDGYAVDDKGRWVE